jgi:hypothetical protein
MFSRVLSRSLCWFQNLRVSVLWLITSHLHPGFSMALLLLACYTWDSPNLMLNDLSELVNLQTFSQLINSFISNQKQSKYLGEKYRHSPLRWVKYWLYIAVFSLVQETGEPDGNPAVLRLRWNYNQTTPRIKPLSQSHRSETERYKQ